MTRKKAIKIAIEAILLQMRRYAFDANTAQRFRRESEWTPTQKNAVKKYKECVKAIEELEAMGQQLTMF